MHPLIPWTPEPAPVRTRVLITAGERDPICPPEETRALEAWFAAQGARGRRRTGTRAGTRSTARRSRAVAEFLR